MSQLGRTALRLMRRLTVSGLMCLTAAVAFGQTSGTLTGRVTDASGNYIPNASVTITNSGTGEQHTAATNDSGIYAFYDLLVGKYDVAVSTNGFKSSTKTGVQLNVGDTLALNFQLEVGSVTESVRVTDATPLINTETADLNVVITSKQVTDLPLNGRAFT
jgi:hypothetical protein